ncbi:MAG: diguanylate cyclase [Lachnospiraceae bacterium]
MNEHDVELLSLQIKRIILNKPILPEMKSEAEELSELQELIDYLAQCLRESDEFLKNLSCGNLDAPTPDRHNFLAGGLKDLHAGLRHLTWQTNQVANGDYGQRVSFLGEFSDSFNKMTGQLQEREEKLKKQTQVITKSMDLLVAIMGALSDWIVVTDIESGEVLYTNPSAKKLFYNPETGKSSCGKSCDLLNHLRSYKMSDQTQVYEYHCPLNEYFLYAKSFLIQWDERMAYAHLIADVTSAREEKEELEEMVFKDTLTGLYNRRYGMQQLNEFLEEQRTFCACMIDLDRLKVANDCYGHGAGDEYIKTVSEQMRKIVRKADIISRIGGDEFLMLFLDCEEKLVEKKMDTLNEKLASIEKKYEMSVSYGVVWITPETPLSAKVVLQQADEKMYAQKNAKKAMR